MICVKKYTQTVQGSKVETMVKFKPGIYHSSNNVWITLSQYPNQLTKLAVNNEKFLEDRKTRKLVVKPAVVKVLEGNRKERSPEAKNRVDPARFDHGIRQIIK